VGGISGCDPLPAATQLQRETVEEFPEDPTNVQVPVYPGYPPPRPVSGVGLGPSYYPASLLWSPGPRPSPVFRSEICDCLSLNVSISPPALDNLAGVASRDYDFRPDGSACILKGSELLHCTKALQPLDAHIHAMYTQPARLRHRCKASGTLVDILATTGLQQGDTATMLLWNLAFRPVILEWHPCAMFFGIY
jgi:hypothetical protein